MLSAGIRNAEARRVLWPEGSRHTDATAKAPAVAYTGNTHDTAGQSTYCHHRGQLVIERDWYRLGAYRLTPEGQCMNCSTPVPGVFDPMPGAWGPRRLPIQLTPPARPGHR